MDERLLPLGGISNKTTVGENENGRRMIYLSDRYGFNNPDSEWDAKEVEWLLTGDSFAEGEAVQPGEDIAGQIRAITHQSSINLGRAGNGPLMELAELIEYAGAVKPRIVLWIYYGNDQNDLYKESLSSSKAGETFPLATLRKVFGDPDESDDRRWIFKGLRIQDPASGDSFDTAVFRYKDGKVTAIRIE